MRLPIFLFFNIRSNRIIFDHFLGLFFSFPVKKKWTGDLLGPAVLARRKSSPPHQVVRLRANLAFIEDAYSRMKGHEANSGILPSSLSLATLSLLFFYQYTSPSSILFSPNQ